MHKRLKWNAIGLVKKTQLLLNAIQEEKGNIPEDHLSKHRKLQGFLDQLSYILEQMERIQKELIPKLKSIFNLEFRTPELVMLSLCRPSIRNIYEDMEKHFQSQKNNPLKEDEYTELASSGDAANVLALIGDSVLDLGVVQTLWDSSLSTVGQLTKKRAGIVANDNLARICDEWNLYDFRMTRLHDPSEKSAKPKTIQHEKGTLIEAIYGVIYLEFGFEELIRTIPLIQ
ncbi:MAG: ribonuclease III domain-containing protein [Promethearchaeota archaeon]